MINPKILPTFFAPAERADEAELARQIELWNGHPLLKMMVDAIPSGVLILNKERQAVFFNRAFLQMADIKEASAAYGRRPGEILNCKNAFLEEGGCGTSLLCDRCGAVRAVLSSLKGIEDIQECVIVPVDDKPTLNLRVWATPITIQGELFSVFAVEDIELEIKNKELTEKLQEMVIRDPLTMLHNRRHLFNEADREFSRSRRYRHPLSLLMVDIDFFKQVNDTYGHDAGDCVLVGMAEVMRSVMRKEDLLVRYGGEEFVIMLPEAGAQEACEVSERLRKTMADKVFEVGDQNISVTISIGVAGTYDDELIPFEALLKQADTALYEAKAAGRNCVRIGNHEVDCGQAE